MAIANGKQFLHWEVDAGPKDSIEVVFDHAANVQLLDPSNFAAYKNGRPYRYRGGYVTKSPFRVTPPHQGHWHIVVDFGGGSGTVRASVRVLSGV